MPLGLISLAACMEPSERSSNERKTGNCPVCHECRFAGWGRIGLRIVAAGARGQRANLPIGEGQYRLAARPTAGPSNSITHPNFSIQAQWSSLFPVGESSTIKPRHLASLLLVLKFRSSYARSSYLFPLIRSESESLNPINVMPRPVVRWFKSLSVLNVFACCRSKRHRHARS
jgi:hypothetical protein